ncbi:hypothetical protein [Clostridium butyricum]|uniref:hypothetical protein n=1 Tax=Clostridium butyricum TaxID=1492 RepID=UPI000AE2BF36|nr:hypothetical protein [Clostridium butyricum]
MEKINIHSKIIYTGFLNSEKDILEHGFSVYPSTYSLLGFIQNIFLSTAFFTWFDTNYMDFCIPMDTFYNVMTEVNNNNLINSNGIDLFKKSYEFLENLWILDENTIMDKLYKFCNSFNCDWNNDPYKKLFIKIFNSPEEIYPFIIETIGWDCEEFIEEEISMSTETFKNTCDNVFSQPFINEKFIDILNINIPILF